MTVREYREDVSDGRPLKEDWVLVPEDALFLKWLKDRGAEHVEEVKSGDITEYWYVLRRDGWLLAIIFP